MAIFGNYQVEDEVLYVTAFGSVRYATAASASGSGGKLVAKIFAPAEAMDEGEEAAKSPRGKAFLQAAHIQKQVAESATHWAPIYEVGTAEGKPYYITDYYPRTISKLIGRVTLDPKSLHEIMQSIVAGLVELRSACKRSHGNIKPTNVLIAGSASLAEGKVVLTDLAAGACNDAAAEAKDLRGVGELLYQLVTRKQAQSLMLSVAESEEWAQLGRRGRDWRQLCGNLLSLDPAERGTLSDLERQVKRLVPITVPVGKIAAAVIGCTAVLGAAGWGTSKWEQSARAEVVAAQGQWFAVLQDPAQAGVLESEPYLRDCLTADRSHMDLMQAALEAEGWAALKPAVIHQVLDARNIARDSRRTWIEAYKKDAKELADKLKVFEDRGWRMTGATLPTADDAAAAMAIAQGAKQLHDLRQRITGNDPTPRWSELQSKISQLRATNDPYLARFADVLQQNGAKAISLSDKSWIATPALQQSIDLVSKLIAKGKVDFDATRYAAEETSVNLEHPQVAQIDRWLATVDLYVPVADAGEKAAHDCRTVFTEQIADGIAKNEDRWPDWHTAAFSDERTKIEENCAALSRRTFLVKDLRLDAENKGPLYATRTSIQQQIAALRTKYYKAPPDPSEFADSLPTLALRDTRLKAIYDRNINDLRNKKPGDIPAAQLEKRKVQIQSLQRALKTLDAFAVAPEKFADKPDVSAQYQAIAATRRAATIEPLIARVGDGMSPAAADLDRLAAESQQASIAYAQWCNNARDLARDLGIPPAENVILEISSFPDQGWRTSSDPQVSAFWKSEVRTPGGAFNALLGAYLNRLDALRMVQEEKDLAKVTEVLAAASNSSPAEILVAAWRRVAGEGILASPATIDRLAQEGAIRLNLASVKSAVDGRKLLASETLIGDLQQELGRAPSRWCAAAKSAKSASDIRTALANSRQFDLNFTIDESAIPAGKVVVYALPTLTSHVSDLGPVASYNLSLALAQDAIESKSNGGMPTRLDTLMRTADSLPSAARSDFIPLIRWLSTARTAYNENIRLQAEALLTDSLYWFPPGQQPNVLAQVFNASGKLKEKQPQQALALLKSFQPSDAGPALLTQFAKKYYELGGALAADIEAQKDAYMQSMRLGNKDAIASLMKLDKVNKTALAADLKALADAGNVDAQVQVARIYETGWGVGQNLAEARRYYTLADYRQNAEAHDWLKTHPLPPPEPVYADESLATRMLSQYQSDVGARRWADAAADLKKFDSMRDVSPQTRQKIDVAIATFSPPAVDPTPPVQNTNTNTTPVTVVTPTPTPTQTDPPVGTTPKRRPRAGN